MNISDLNNKIYGYKNLKDGEHTNFFMKSIEEQEMKNFNINGKISNNFDEINKEIKF